MSHGLTKRHGLTKTLTGPIVTSDVVIHYALSKLTKRYSLISCFNVSILLIFLTNILLIIQFVLIFLHFKYRIMISGIFDQTMLIDTVYIRF